MNLLVVRTCSILQCTASSAATNDLIGNGPISCWSDGQMHHWWVHASVGWIRLVQKGVVVLGQVKGWLWSHRSRAAVITWAIGVGVWYLVKWLRNLVFAFSWAAVCQSLGQQRTWSISSCHALQAKHCLSILLSWVACWCSVGVQLWANLASWYCWPLVRQPKEDRALF